MLKILTAGIAGLAALNATAAWLLAADWATAAVLTLLPVLVVSAVLAWQQLRLLSPVRRALLELLVAESGDTETAQDGRSGLLLQTYRRDTGEIMHDLSVPVYVNGKHWGGFRIGYFS